MRQYATPVPTSRTAGTGCTARARIARTARSRPDREAGRIVTMVPLATLAALIAVGIGVDFAGQTVAEQNLRDVATYCARTGASQGVLGAQASAIAVSTAYQCLTAQGVTGTVSLTTDSLTVTLTGTYTTRLLTIVGINRLPLTATGSTTIRQGR